MQGLSGLLHSVRSAAYFLIAAGCPRSPMLPGPTRTTDRMAPVHVVQVASKHYMCKQCEDSSEHASAGVCRVLAVTLIWYNKAGLVKGMCVCQLDHRMHTMS